MKAVIYVRISTTKQNTDRQYAELEAYAKRNNYTIVGTYEDRISGFKDEENRVELNRLKRDATTDKFQIILFSELSRLSRQTIKILELIKYFRDDNGKSLYFEKQNLLITKDKSDLGSELQISILSTIGSYEIELSTERQMGGKIEKVRKGLWTHGSRPYGYIVNDDKSLSINNEEADIIRQIFNQFLNGSSSVKIAHLLNGKNIPAPSKKNKRQNLWHPNSVHQLLKSKRYIGEFEATYHQPDPKNEKKIRERKDRVIVEKIKRTNKELAIIDENIFNSVNELIIKNRLNKDTAKKNISLLKKILICGNCGSNHYYKLCGKNAGYSYRCFGSRFSFAINGKKCYNPITIHAEKIDGLIIDMAKSKLLNEKYLFSDSDSIKNENTKKINENENIIEGLYLSIKQINNGFNQYLFNASQYNIEQSIIDEEYKKKEKKISKINFEINDLSKANIMLLKQNKILSKKKILTEEMSNLSCLELKKLFEEYIEKVLIYNTKQWAIVNIKYIFGDDEFGFIRKSAKANELLHYSNIAKDILNKSDYKFLSEHNLLHVNEKCYYYPYYDNNKKEVKYDIATEKFIVRDKECSISDFINSLYPQKMNEVHAYEFYNFHEKLKMEL